MQARAGGLTNGVQARQVGAAVQVGQHAAAGVVGGGHHGNGVFADVNAQLQASSVNVGKVRQDESQRLVRDVEVDTVQAVFFHLEVNRAGHHVTRGQLSARVVLGHEANAVR